MHQLIRILLWYTRTSQRKYNTKQVPLKIIRSNCILLSILQIAKLQKSMRRDKLWWTGKLLTTFVQLIFTYFIFPNCCLAIIFLLFQMISYSSLDSSFNGLYILKLNYWGCCIAEVSIRKQFNWNVFLLTALQNSFSVWNTCAHVCESYLLCILAVIKRDRLLL